MAEPLTAIGAVAGVAQIAVYCLKSIQILEHTRVKFRDGAAILESLRAESQLVHSSLVELETFFGDDKNQLSAALRTSPHLFANLQRTLASCDVVYKCLNKEVVKISEASETTRTTRLLTKEKVLQEFLTQVKGHQITLTLLIQGIQMRSLDMIITILTSIQQMSPRVDRKDSFGSLHGSTHVPDDWEAGFFAEDSAETLTYHVSFQRDIPNAPDRRGSQSTSGSLDHFARRTLSPCAKIKSRSPKLDNIDEAEGRFLPEPALGDPIFIGSLYGKRIRSPQTPLESDKMVVDLEEKEARERAGVAVSAPLEGAEADKIFAISPRNPSTLQTRTDAKCVWRQDPRVSVATTTSMTSLDESIGRAASAYFPAIPNPSRNTPPLMDDVFTNLDDRRQRMIMSCNDREVLDWAEEVFCYMAFRKGLVNDKTTPSSVQDAGATRKVLEEDAKTRVEELAKQSEGKALYLKARWFELSPEEQMQLFYRAAAKGYGRAAARVGMALEIGEKQDKKAAAGYYWQAQGVDDTAATLRIAEATLKGDLGIKKSHKGAAQLFRQAAAQADLDCPEAAYRLAELQSGAYRKTFRLSKSDLPISDDSAREHYLKAAALRHPKALLTIGLAYQNGTLGLPISAAYSLHYLRLASQAGESEADFAISTWFWWGQDNQIEPNLEIAYRFARKSAEQAYVPAYCQVGYFFEHGLGMERKDLGRARDWYLKGAAAGDPMASKRLDALITKLRFQI